MKAIDLVKAIFYPLTEFSVLVPLVFFTLLLSLAQLAGLLGMLLMIIVFLGAYRYQMTVLEARAQGKAPATPDVESFNWFGDAWSLFPVPLVALIVWGVLLAADYLRQRWRARGVVVRWCLFAGVTCCARDHAFTVAKPKSLCVGSIVESLWRDLLDRLRLSGCIGMVMPAIGDFAAAVGKLRATIPDLFVFFPNREPYRAVWTDRRRGYSRFAET